MRENCVLDADETGCGGHTDEEHMAAYDALPLPIRNYLANADEDFCAVLEARRWHVYRASRYTAQDYVDEVLEGNGVAA